MNIENKNSVEEEEDTWNPNPHAPSILKKQLIDITEKLEEEEEENYKLFGTLNYEEFKKEALANRASKDADIAKRVEEMKKNITRDPDQPAPKKRKNQLMKLIDKAVKKTSKKVTKAASQPEKDMKADEEVVPSSEDDLDEGEEDDENNMMYELKNKVEGAENPFTENLYDPIQDDKYNDWVEKKFRKDKTSNIVLSCPYCFMQLCYDSQRHESYENQYRAIFVKNCKIDSSKPLKFSKEQDKRTKKTKKHKDDMEEQDQNDFSKPFEEMNPKDFEYFFPIHCSSCNTEVGVYDFEEKVYHFFSVVPSLG